MNYQADKSIEDQRQAIDAMLENDKQLQSSGDKLNSLERRY